MNINNGNITSPSFDAGCMQQAPQQQPAYGGQPDWPEPQMGVGQWMLTIFLLGIPIVNLIFLIVWACGDKRMSPRVNFARAYLIWMAITAVLFFVLFFIILLFSAGAAVSYY